jgi:hypothetical protein
LKELTFCMPCTFRELTKPITSLSCLLVGNTRLEFQNTNLKTSSRAHVGRADVSHEVCSALGVMKMVVHLLNTVDRLAFLQAVVHQDKTTVALQPRAVHVVPEHLLFRQPRAYSLLTRFARYLALLLRLFRERMLLRFGGREGAGGVDDRAHDVRSMHDLAFQVAMAHEVRNPSYRPSPASI